MGLGAYIGGIVTMSLILVFALIHLAVSISILVTNDNYNSLYGPEIGLAGYNVAVGFLGLLVGAIGLTSVITKLNILSKIIAIVSFILGIFALASLITSLVINSNSAGDVSSYFSRNMQLYYNDSNAKSMVDRVQTNYQCCGANLWLDWTTVQAGTTIITTTTTTSVTVTTLRTTATSAAITTTKAGGVTTTTVAGATTTTIEGATTTTITAATTTTIAGATTITIAGATTTTITAATTTTIAGATTTTIAGATTTTIAGATTAGSGDATTTTPMSRRKARAVSVAVPAPVLSIIHTDVRRAINDVAVFFDLSPAVNRIKRQTGSTTSNTISLSYSSQFYVPTTCCANKTTCTSSSQLYTNGCSQYIIGRVNQQNMGIGVINCFMLVLAFSAIPLLFQDHSQFSSHDQNMADMQQKQMQSFAPYYSHPSTVVTSYH